MLPAPTDPGDGLLFHVSFDQTREADFAAGATLPYLAEYARADRTAAGGTLVDGVFGKALTGGSRYMMGAYDALANFCPERGTVAFFIREQQQLYGFETFTVNTVDDYYWRMYLRLSNKSNALSAWFPDEVYRPVILNAPAQARLRGGTWHHIAVAWDQTQGCRYYFDGEEVASNWGEVQWCSRGVDPDKLTIHHSDNVAYDELYVFDRPLTAVQIRTLRDSNRGPDGDQLQALPWDDACRQNRLRELSWQTPDPAIPVLGLGTGSVEPTALRQVFPTNARAVKKDGSEAVDGKLGHGWPPLYNYEYNDGNGFHVELPEPYDLIVTEGYFTGNVYDHKTLTEDGQSPFLRTQATAFATRHRLDRPRPAGWLSFFKGEMEDKGDLPDKELVTASRLCEVGFFRVGSHALDDARAQSHYFGPASADAGKEALGAEFAGRYGPGDRAAFGMAPGPQPTDATGQTLAALRYHHLLFTPAGRDTPLAGLRLAWRLQGDLADNCLAVTVHDPALPGRRLFHADFRLTPADALEPQDMDLWLDLADYIVPGDKPLWVTFCFKREVALLWGDDGKASRVDLLTTSPKAAMTEYLRTQLTLAKGRFRPLSESRPWGAHEKPEEDMPVFNRRSRELFYPLKELWRLSPDDPKTKALWLWTHKFHQDTSPVEPLPVAGAQDAPRWALLQRELFNRCLDVLHWWIDNRQTPNGEFGDAWGDDTDLIQNFAKLALVRDPGNRLRDAVKLVADGVYKSGLIKNGINARTMDTLHAYEEGVNAQPVMALIDYGNPLYLERMMEAAKTVEGHLTGVNAQGVRRFRSGHFSAHEVLDKGNYGVDFPGNALFCHPALFVSYYSHHPRTVAFLQEWIDGWLKLYEQAEAEKQEWPSRTLFDLTVVARDYKVRGYGFIDLFPALFRLTGEERYRDAVRLWDKGENQFPHRGIAGILPVLDIADWDARRDDIVNWAQDVDLTHPSDDSLGAKARQRFAEWEATGNEDAAYEALEACVRKLRLTFDAHTWAEPIDDRIWLPDHPLIVMMQGEMSDERNQLYPRHYVSYEGFTDFAAWVREKSDEKLRLWVYSFSNEPEDGLLRVWRTPLGQYRVTVGPDADGDCVPDGGATSRRLELHRYAAVPVTLAPRQLTAVTIELVEQSTENFWLRPDLALSTDDLEWSADGSSLTVPVHNLGNVSVTSADVSLTDHTGAEIARQTIDKIPAPLDLVPKRASVTFAHVPAAARPVTVHLDRAGRIAELNEDNNTVSVSGR